MLSVLLIFFFKQKTAYEMRISDFRRVLFRSGAVVRPVALRSASPSFSACSKEETTAYYRFFRILLNFSGKKTRASHAMTYWTPLLSALLCLLPAGIDRKSTRLNSSN